MSYRIVADSSCDKTSVMNDWNNITFVPLSLEIGDYRILDDENFNQEDFVERMKAFGGTAKTACPAPSAWADAFDCDEEDIYVVTITDKLSGTYNSALQGKALFEEESQKKKNIHVFNSLATSGLESLVAEKINEVADSGMPFEEVVNYIEDFIVNHAVLYFCLDSLDVLKNNGRLFAVAASVLEKLRVKLIGKAVDGNISLAGRDLTVKKALVKTAGIIRDDVAGIDLSDKRLVISHVCCEDRAILLKNKIESYVKFGSVEIVKCSGLNTTYASNGGIIVSYTK